MTADSAEANEWKKRRRLQGRLRQGDGGGLDSSARPHPADLRGGATTDAADELLNLAQGFHF